MAATERSGQRSAARPAGRHRGPGRAVTPALEILSDRYGVSLRVLPENRKTVGERKLTIIATDCSLEALLTLIPTALQECHWDIDRAGTHPVYYLHGDAGLGPSPAASPSPEAARSSAMEVPSAYLNEVEQALSLNREGLPVLEGQDLFLAEALRLPDERQRVEACFELSSVDRQQLVLTGSLRLAYQVSTPPGTAGRTATGS